MKSAGHADLIDDRLDRLARKFGTAQCQGKLHDSGSFLHRVIQPGFQEPSVLDEYRPPPPISSDESPRMKRGINREITLLKFAESSATRAAPQKSVSAFELSQPPSPQTILQLMTEPLGSPLVSPLLLSDECAWIEASNAAFAAEEMYEGQHLVVPARSNGGDMPGGGLMSPMNAQRFSKRQRRDEPATASTATPVTRHNGTTAVAATVPVAGANGSSSSKQSGNAHSNGTVHSSSSGGYSLLLGEAKKLKHAADKMDKEHRSDDAIQLYFHAGLKFMECAQYEEDKRGAGSGSTMFRDTAKLFDFIARKCAGAGNQASAALAYQCVSQCYQHACPSSRLGSMLDELRSHQAQLLPSPGSTPPLPSATAANPSATNAHPSPSPTPSPPIMAATAGVVAGASPSSSQPASISMSIAASLTRTKQQQQLFHDLELLVRSADAQHRALVASGMSRRHVLDFCARIRDQLDQRPGS
eukprot:TRINITY_DN3208_c0_g1_i3.p1 TRINITY_DN3208_c0_g1~~TRINITY_DN3208_c0_g1_i3.p1  ORF type:complete len:472 (-),score=19.67 TRINITY_DN3208_c0_g1_i3:178-1593(-)